MQCPFCRMNGCKEILDTHNKANKYKMNQKTKKLVNNISNILF